MRILFNTPKADLHGGPPTHLPLLEQELRTYLELENFDYGRKHDTESIFEKCLGRAADLRRLRSQILRSRPDIIHHNTSFDPIAFLRDAPLVHLCKRHKVPLFLKLHGSFNESFGKLNPIVQYFRDYILRNVQGIGVLSDAERQAFLDHWPYLSGRVKVVKNIIHPSFYNIPRTESPLPILLFVSRFIRKKGIFDILQAIPAIRKKVPAAHFVFVGSGGEASEFDKRLQLQGLSDYVQRLEHLPNLSLAKYYATAWALLFPTHFPEGMPMVVAEAMAAGLPIITTRTKFAQSYLRAEKNCLFIERNSPACIEKAVVHLVEHPGLRRELSQNNRQLARLFQAPVVGREFIDIYQRVLANTPFADMATRSQPGFEG